MADLLIKGWEMPIDCFHCPCEYDNDCMVDNDNRSTNLKRRPEWCPLVEVPTPHGRLIDANELKRLFFFGNGTATIDMEELQWKINFVIDCMPTIIEASEVENEDQ